MTGRFTGVSVLYPRGRRTGGPEALHQLVDSLRGQNVDAALVPIPGTEHLSRALEYEKYDAPERPAFVDEADHAVVFPESWIPRGRPTRATSIMWWLSVDNARPFLARQAWRTRHVGRGRTPAWVVGAAALSEAAVWPVRRRALLRVEHLAQSHYAQRFVENALGVGVAIVSDYVVVEKFPRAPHRPIPVVAYNAAKSTRQLEAMRDLVRTRVQWLPLINMTPREVQEALARTDVYLELGRLPGKDRLPREAAALGALVLIGAVGAGANDVDLPVPPNHRMASGTSGAAMAETLDQVLGDLATNRSTQQTFRAHVEHEKERFDHEVAAAFGLKCQ